MNRVGSEKKIYILQGKRERVENGTDGILFRESTGWMGSKVANEASVGQDMADRWAGTYVARELVCSIIYIYHRVS